MTISDKVAWRIGRLDECVHVNGIPGWSMMILSDVFPLIAAEINRFGWIFMDMWNTIFMDMWHLWWQCYCVLSIEKSRKICSGSTVSPEAATAWHAVRKFWVRIGYYAEVIYFYFSTRRLQAFSVQRCNIDGLTPCRVRGLLWNIWFFACKHMKLPLVTTMFIITEVKTNFLADWL